MATLKFAKVLVSRGPMEKIAKVAPLHEIPILREIHGKTSVAVGETVASEIPVPGVEEEHARLCAAYGVHPDAGIPYAEKVYGMPESGGLAKALEAAADNAPRARRERHEAEAA